jgi:hypothetical protein
MQRLTFMAAAAGLLLASSCGGEDLPTNRGAPPDQDGGGGFSFDGAPIPDDGGELPGICPADPPKLGENCGPDFSESTMCELKVGECTIPGMGNFVDHIVFCCPIGVWEICGMRTPCDNAPPPDPTPVPDAAADLAPPPDGGVDAGDAAADASPDLSPDLALSPDLEPDLSSDL